MASHPRVCCLRKGLETRNDNIFANQAMVTHTFTTFTGGGTCNEIPCLYDEISITRVQSHTRNINITGLSPWALLLVLCTCNKYRGNKLMIYQVLYYGDTCIHYLTRNSSTMTKHCHWHVNHTRQNASVQLTMMATSAPAFLSDCTSFVRAWAREGVL